MSFLLRTARVPMTASYVSTQPARFSTSILRRKDATETIKEAAKTVDQAVADKAIKGIDLGESAAAKIKETFGVKSGEAKGKAAELTGKAKGKAAELEGEAKAKLS